ncbi:MAG: hypothetical protein IPK10_18665 [Bacteroidetes bacterium]|nr:hypothetical protein [Bacteroidota bacterium]
MHTILASDKSSKSASIQSHSKSRISNTMEANLLMLFDERIPFYILRKHVE